MADLIVEISKIERIEPHTNADRIEVAVVKGWNCIIQKGQYKAGDVITFIPPDSIIPQNLIEKHELEFLRKDGRVKVIKLRGFVSQGLILPAVEGYNVGEDVGEALGIKKYEPSAPKYQNSYGKKTSKKIVNPYFDKCTSPNNVRYYPELFKEGEQVVVTEKIHGTSWRAGTLPYKPKNLFSKIKVVLLKIVGKYRPYEFVYGSHNVQITHNNKYKGFYGEDIYGRVAEKYNVKELIPPDYTVFGEVYGEGIQDLEYGLIGDLRLMVFDVKYKGVFLDYPEMINFCQEFNLPHVPVLYVGEYYNGLVQEHTDGMSTIAPDQIREGCVIKSLNEVNDFRVGRKILKSISEDYLIRNDATEYH